MNLDLPTKSAKRHEAAENREVLLYNYIYIIYYIIYIYCLTFHGTQQSIITRSERVKNGTREERITHVSTLNVPHSRSTARRQTNAINCGVMVAGWHHVVGVVGVDVGTHW